MYEIVSIIFSLASFLLLLLEISIYQNEIGSVTIGGLLYLIIINFVPVLILMGIGLIAKKFNWKKVINICATVIFFILVIPYYLFMSIGMTAGAIFWNSPPKEPEIENYQSVLYKIKSKYTPGFDHFPKVLPNNISNYYFFIENSFDGYDTHYLKFNTNFSYINNELKIKCDNKTISKEQVKEENYMSYYTIKFNDAECYCILHKRTPKEKYTTGIATNSNHDLIYYFYANY